ncbi:MAG: hypothetical protein M3O73_01605 [Actinomycetota bacterium]|nr:hypothetical protein [Actinomycetota bacterium]
MRSEVLEDPDRLFLLTGTYVPCQLRPPTDSNLDRCARDAETGLIAGTVSDEPGGDRTCELGFKVLCSSNVSEVRDVVWLDQLALDDRKVDLDLVEPAGVHRQMNEDEVRPAPLEAPNPLTVAVGEPLSTIQDSAGGGVGLLGHHLPDERLEGGDSASGLGAAEDTRGATSMTQDSKD